MEPRRAGGASPWGRAGAVPALLLCAWAYACSAESGAASGSPYGAGGAAGSAAAGAGATGGGGATGGTGGQGTGATGGTIAFDAGGDGGTGPAPSTPVTAIITADNAYGFGYGDGDSMDNYFGGVENTTAGEIFNCPVGNGPEQYTVPADSANVGAYLYLVGWADRSTTQGILGRFAREGAEAVKTGEGAWEACATGVEYGVGTGGPPLDVINAQIALCNAGTGDPTTTSAGWVGTAATAGGAIAFGEDNTTDRGTPTPGNEFPLVCEIDPSARWMWFDWDASDGQSPFLWPGGSGNPIKQFILFRLGAEYIPEPPA